MSGEGDKCGEPCLDGSCGAPGFSQWISVKDRLPEEDRDQERKFVLATHTIYGVGVGWFWRLDGDQITELEEDFKDKYVCSCRFIKSKVDENYLVDVDDDIDVFENSPHFANLGTVTHWMPLPSPPNTAGTSPGL